MKLPIHGLAAPQEIQPTLSQILNVLAAVLQPQQRAELDTFSSSSSSLWTAITFFFLFM